MHVALSRSTTALWRVFKLSRVGAGTAAILRVVRQGPIIGQPRSPHPFRQPAHFVRRGRRSGLSVLGLPDEFDRLQSVPARIGLVLVNLAQKGLRYRDRVVWGFKLGIPAAASIRRLMYSVSASMIPNSAPIVSDIFNPYVRLWTKLVAIGSSNDSNLSTLKNRPIFDRLPGALAQFVQFGFVEIAAMGEKL